MTQRPGSESRIGSAIEVGPIPAPSNSLSSTFPNTSLWVTSPLPGLILSKPSTSTEPSPTRRIESRSGSNSHMAPDGMCSSSTDTSPLTQ